MVKANVIGNVYPQKKTLVGIVTAIIANRILFKTNTAAQYDAETVNAKLVRKNGAPMEFKEIAIGDKVEVRGMVWQDNSVNAVLVRNLSLYVHNSTFTGKVTATDGPNGIFTMQSRQHGTQIVHIHNLVIYKRNNGSATVQDLSVGVTTKVKGTWERTSQHITATTVTISARLLNIDITGEIVVKGPDGITVVADRVMYGVDIANAKLQSKNGKPILPAELTAGGAVKVQGKHIAESPRITALLVKDLSVIK